VWFHLAQSWKVEALYQNTCAQRDTQRCTQRDTQRHDGIKQPHIADGSITDVTITKKTWWPQLFVQQEYHLAAANTPNVAKRPNPERRTTTRSGSERPTNFTHPLLVGHLVDLLQPLLVVLLHVPQFHDVLRQALDQARLVLVHLAEGFQSRVRLFGGDRGVGGTAVARAGWNDKILGGATATRWGGSSSVSRKTRATKEISWPKRRGKRRDKYTTKLGQWASHLLRRSSSKSI